MATTVKESSKPTEGRGQRADARRNRAKVLAAARVGFARDGLEAQMDDIARQAGVGVGTVYRHFPRKEDLLKALVDEHFETLAGSARQALQADDPWEGFVEYLTFATRSMVEDRALVEAMSALAGFCREAAMRSGLERLNAEIVARAQADGRLRADVVPEDIPALAKGIGRAVDSRPGEPTMSWDRYLNIILAGLTAPCD